MNGKRNLMPSTREELDLLFDQYRAMLDAILNDWQFSYINGPVAEWQRWAFYANQES